MTDTTDIKALREFLMEQIDHADSYGGKVWLCAEDARLAMSSLDQLEAERQRADANEPVRCEGVPQHVHDMIDMQETIDELRAEIAALKGDQVPVAWRFKNESGEYRVSIEKKPNIYGRTDFEPLFTATQKPVVLPIDEMSYKDACAFVSINGMRNEDRPTLAMRVWNSCRKAAIEAAVGIVKDGE